MIDGTFVRGIGANDADEAISATILAMARTLRLLAVAEGVEAEHQLEFLGAQGYQRAQGLLFGPPVPHQELVKLMDTSLAPPELVTLPGE